MNGWSCETATRSREHINPDLGDGGGRICGRLARDPCRQVDLQELSSRCDAGARRFEPAARGRAGDPAERDEQWH